MAKNITYHVSLDSYVDNSLIRVVGYIRGQAENTLFTNRIESKAKARVKLQAKSGCAPIIR